MSPAAFPPLGGSPVNVAHEEPAEPRDPLLRMLGTGVDTVLFAPVIATK